MDILGEVSFTTKSQIGTGQGMNSQVFLADDPQLGAEIVVKTIEKNNLGNTVADYFREAQALFASRHANVAEVHYCCQTVDHVHIAMPYYRAGSLADRIASSPLDLLSTLNIGHDILNGLSQIHNGQHIHFDVKPSNVLFSSSGVALVADFGQSRRFDATGVATVPPLYVFAIPPECFLHQAGTVASDVYQAGLTLYRAVNGEPHYRAQIPNWNDVRDAVVSGRFPDRTSFLPHVPDRLRRVIRTALSVDPSRRFQSATAFSNALSGVDLPLNWKPTATSSGMTWVADRAGKPSLIVEHVVDSAGSHVRTFTEGVHGRRACRKSDFWLANAKAKDAGRHLKRVFSALK